MQDLSLLVTLSNATLKQINAVNGVANIQLTNGKLNNITLSNPTPGIYTLNLQQDAKGYCAVNFLTPITWSGNTFPLLSTQPNAVDVVELVYDGTSWAGNPNNYVARTETMMVFRTTAANEVVTLPYEVAGTYTGTIYWGDGSSSANSYAGRTHTYAVAGDYLIVVNGGISGFTFNNAGDKLKIIQIINWGTAFRLGNTGGYFYGCTNLTIDTVADVLNLAGTTTFVNAFNGCASLVKVNRMNEWDTSLVTSFASLFDGCVKFNQYINNWNTSSVTTMANAFRYTNAFNQPLGAWNTSNVTTIANMFRKINVSLDVFNQNLNTWDVSKVTDMSNAFGYCTVFNSPLNAWNTSSAILVNGMFTFCYAFNQSLSNWNTANVTTMSQMFYNCWELNQDFSSWNTSKTTNMEYTFGRCYAFNQPLNSWDVSKVTSTQFMFYCSISFNQDLSSWNTGLVTNMAAMFFGGVGLGSSSGEMAFNGNISSWNTANVINMSNLFKNCSSFNQDISSWNTAKVTTMATMFNNARAFNQPIGSWNVANVTSMSGMFQNATGFNQNIGSWNIAKVTNFINFMTIAPLNKALFLQIANSVPDQPWVPPVLTMSMSPANVSAMYNGWALLTPVTSRGFQADASVRYDASGTAGRNTLTNGTNKWTIQDGGCAL